MTERPKVLCPCGSARFQEAFSQSYLQETLAGHIVLSIALFPGGDETLFRDLTADALNRTKAQLNELHLRKIDLADEVLILNVGGYIGESTTAELAYAKRQGKRVRFWDKGHL